MNNGMWGRGAGLWLLAVGALGSVAPAAATSLFSEANYRPLITDQRAHRVGDILTVLIFESAASETRADTGTNRSTDLSASASDSRTRHSAALGINNEFEGGGSISRTGKLMARVSVTVEEIGAGGDLVVSGEQLIEFNDEHQYIRLNGRVRPEDIAADNTVISTRLADARIQYVGDGILGARQRPGWLSRFFAWLF